MREKERHFIDWMLRTAVRRMSQTVGPLVGALDIGTSSTRFIIFNQKGETVCAAQQPLKSLHPHPGWVEQCPHEMISCVNSVVDEVSLRLSDLGIVVPGQKLNSVISSIGITNQRETSILWDPQTAQPHHNAIGLLLLLS